jgi:beta-galactosidase
VADTIAWFCRQIKEYTGNSVLTGSFYAYILYVTDSTGGNFGLSQLLKSPDIDYICTTGFHCPVESVQLAGKLFITEADIRTCLTQAPGVTMPQIMPNNTYYIGGVWGGPDRANSVADMRKRSMEVLTRHTGIWWFDMWGGWYRSPRIFDVVQKMHLEYVKAFQRGSCENAEVAIVLDSQTSYGVNGECFMATVQKQLVVFGNVGVPYHLYLKGCLKDGELDKYRLVVFLSPYAIDETDKRRMCALQENGTSVVVTGRNGRGANVADCFDGAIDESTIRSYCYQANVHLYTKNDAVVYANSHYISVTAKQDGEQTIYCKRDGSLQDVLSSEIYTTIDKKLALTMKENQTILLKYVE